MPKTTTPHGAKKASSTATSRPGKIKIAGPKATASAIRESLGVTPAEAKAGSLAIRSVRASALAKGAAPKTVKQKKSAPVTTR
jgi:hypothetical protein